MADIDNEIKSLAKEQKSLESTLSKLREELSKNTNKQSTAFYKLGEQFEQDVSRAIKFIKKDREAQLSEQGQVFNNKVAEVIKESRALSKNELIEQGKKIKELQASLETITDKEERKLFEAQLKKVQSSIKSQTNVLTNIRSGSEKLLGVDIFSPKNVSTAIGFAFGGPLGGVLTRMIAGRFESMKAKRKELKDERAGRIEDLIDVNKQSLTENKEQSVQLKNFLKMLDTTETGVANAVRSGELTPDNMNEFVDGLTEGYKDALGPQIEELKAGMKEGFVDEMRLYGMQSPEQLAEALGLRGSPPYLKEILRVMTENFELNKKWKEEQEQIADRNRSLMLEEKREEKRKTVREKIGRAKGKKEGGFLGRMGKFLGAFLGPLAALGGIGLGILGAGLGTLAAGFTALAAVSPGIIVAGAALAGFIVAIGAALAGAGFLGKYGLKWLGEGLTGFSKGMKDIGDAVKTFEALDGTKLDTISEGLMKFGIGMGNIIKANILQNINTVLFGRGTEKGLKDFIPVINSFTTSLDGDKLSKIGPGLRDFGRGLRDFTIALGNAEVLKAAKGVKRFFDTTGDYLGFIGRFMMPFSDKEKLIRDFAKKRAAKGEAIKQGLLNSPLFVILKTLNEIDIKGIGQGMKDFNDNFDTLLGKDSFLEKLDEKRMRKAELFKEFTGLIGDGFKNLDKSADALKKLNNLSTPPLNATQGARIRDASMKNARSARNPPPVEVKASTSAVTNNVNTSKTDIHQPMTDVNNESTLAAMQRSRLHGYQW